MIEGDSVFKAAKVSDNSVGALTFVIDNKRALLDYLQYQLLADRVFEEVKELNDILEETEFVLDCFTVLASNLET